MSVLVGVSVVVIKHYDPKQVGDERFYFILQLICASRKVRAGTEAEASYRAILITG